MLRCCFRQPFVSAGWRLGRVVVEEALFGNGPEGGVGVHGFEGVVGPGVAGVEEGVAADGFVEGVVFALQAFADVGNEAAILGAADTDGGAAGAAFEAGVVGGVDGVAG